VWVKSSFVAWLQVISNDKKVQNDLLSNGFRLGMIAPVSSPNMAEEQITAAITSGAFNKILGAAPGSEINQIFHVITNCQPRIYF
jgi:hypothetical protein